MAHPYPSLPQSLQLPPPSNTTSASVDSGDGVGAAAATRTPVASVASPLALPTMTTTPTSGTTAPLTRSDPVPPTHSSHGSHGTASAPAFPEKQSAATALSDPAAEAKPVLLNQKLAILVDFDNKALACVATCSLQLVPPLTSRQRDPSDISSDKKDLQDTKTTEKGGSTGASSPVAVHFATALGELPTCLNFRLYSHCHVTKVTVEGYKVPFKRIDNAFTDALLSVAAPDINMSLYLEKRKKTLLHSAMLGDLVVYLPSKVMDKMIVATSNTPAAAVIDRSPSNVIIHYVIVDPPTDLQFVLPEVNVAPHRPPHFYTQPNCHPAAWLPVWIPFSTASVVTATVKASASPVEASWSSVLDAVPCRWHLDISIKENAYPHNIYVSCPGRVRQMTPDRRRWVYDMRKLHPAQLRLAVIYGDVNCGEWSFPKHVWALPGGHLLTASIPSADSHVNMISIQRLLENDPGKWERERRRSIVSHSVSACDHIKVIVPGKRGRHTAEPTCSLTGKMLGFFEQVLGARFPYPSCELVFVDEGHMDGSSAFSLSGSPYMLGCGGPGVVILNSSVLHKADAIDPVFDTRRTLSKAVAAHWFGHHIYPRLEDDAWIVVGLCHYLSHLFIRKSQGVTEYRYWMMKQIELLASLDIRQPPLSRRPDAAPMDQLAWTRDWEVMKLKSHVLMHIIEQKIGVLMMQRLMNRICTQHASTGITTRQFLDLIFDITGADMTNFADLYVYGSGVPVFSVKFTKKGRKCVDVEIDVKRNFEGGLGKVSGQIKIRVAELGGDFDHFFDLTEGHHKFSLPFQTRGRRSTLKRKSYEDEPEFNDQVAEWKEWIGKMEDDPEHDDQADDLFWVYVDPELEWLRRVKIISQPDLYWCKMLKYGRDVVLESEAVAALTAMPSVMTATTLLRVITNPLHYYRVRMDAAFAMTKLSAGDVGVAAKNSLIGSFKKKWFKQHERHTVLMANDFSSLPNYYVKKAIILALSFVRDKDDQCPNDVIRFLLDLLNANSNLENKFSDDYYVAALITAISNCFVTSKGLLSNKDELLDEAIDIIDRYCGREKLVRASHHNIIMQSCIEALSSLMAAGIIEESTGMFLAHSRWGNFLDLRKICIDAVVLYGFHQVPPMQYLFQLILSDPSPAIRLHTAKALNMIANITNSGALFENRRAALWDSMDALQSAFSILCQGSIALEPACRLELERFICHFYVVAKSLPQVDQPRVVTTTAVIEKDEFGGAIVMEEVSAPPMMLFPGDDDASFSSAHPLADVDSRKRKKESLSDAVGGSGTVGAIKKRKTEGEAADAVSVETLKPPSAPVVIRITARPVTPMQVVKWRLCLRHVILNPYAAPFLEPVPIALIPTYADIIQEPMDFGTIEKKLEKGTYRTVEAFERDMRLVFSNCYTFNAEGDIIAEWAKLVEEQFNADWALSEEDFEQEHLEDEAALASAALLPVDAWLKCKVTLDKLMRNSKAEPFLKPVDPISLGIIGYFGVVKQPMSFSVIRKKLPMSLIQASQPSGPGSVGSAMGSATSASALATVATTSVTTTTATITATAATTVAPVLRCYAHPDEFERDVRQVFANCRAFNREGYFFDLAVSMESTFDRMWGRGVVDIVAGKSTGVADA